MSLSEEDKIKYEVLDYPDQFLPVIYEHPNDFLLFPDALETLMESLDYEILYIMLDKKNELTFIYTNNFDNSSLIIYTNFTKYPHPFYTLYLLKIVKCYEIYDNWEEDATDYIKDLIKHYPKKIDLLYLLEGDSTEFYENLFRKRESKPYLSSPYHYFLKPISKPL
ncbi:MAG: hypothetical protein QXW01_01500 [Candidatus Aenigmatarchaeota archaeon]